MRASNSSCNEDITREQEQRMHSILDEHINNMNAFRPKPSMMPNETQYRNKEFQSPNNTLSYK